MTDDPVVVRRFLPVPRVRVFDAWLDPKSLAQWMCPGDVERASAEVDARVGGRFRIVMHRGEAETEHQGEYIAIEPPALLSFTWISVHTDGQPSVVTVELAERAGGTDLTLTHRRLPSRTSDAHLRGWTDIVGRLEAALAD